MKNHSILLSFFLFAMFTMQSCGPKPAMSEKKYAHKMCECSKTSADMVEYIDTAKVENTDSLYVEARKTFKSIKKCIGIPQIEVTKGMNENQTRRYWEKVMEYAHKDCPEIAKTLSF